MATRALALPTPRACLRRIRELSGVLIAWMSALLLTGGSVCQASDARKAHFVGPETCALCHQDIAAKQARTAMATTWQGPETPWLPPAFQASIADDLTYQFRRGNEAFTYSIDLPGKPPLRLPVDVLMGGRRHGLGFLVAVEQIDGIPLARRALVQARYEWSPEKEKLLIAPGCPNTKPQTLEAALGVVLSPTFQTRCLSCHGERNQRGTGKDGGVRCESCHGPGSEHLVSVGHGDPKQGIVNPKRLSTEASIAVCAGCHVGLTRFSDPSADDLLVANQVLAMKSSECFVQSQAAFSCTACHDPHNDEASLSDARAIKVCRDCHGSGSRLHTAICPVNATGGCIGCHMPPVEMGPLHLVDHLIRVHPEQKIGVAKHGADLRTGVRPVSEYLRIVATNNVEAARAAQERLRQGESFYKVAREVSVDQTAAIGGYLGRKSLAEMEHGLAEEAARLGYGQTSGVVPSGGRWIILQRLPRDFRWDAQQLQSQAEDLAARGDAAAAIGKAQEALMIYPRFLRALNFIGVVFAQGGNPKKGAEVLATAARLYPEDAKTEFALASTLNVLSDQEGARKAYKRAIALEPDFTAAYLNLGLVSSALMDWPGAVEAFRQGLNIDPLSAELYYNLGQALMHSGDTEGANRATALARKLEPALFEAAEPKQ